MFINTWRAWLESWCRGGRRRNEPHGNSLRNTEQLEERFFLGQLSLPSIDSIAPPVSEEVQLDTSEILVPDAHEELAQALEAVFREFTVRAPAGTAENSSQVTTDEGIPAAPQPPARPADTVADDPELASEFTSMSDVGQAELLLESLRTGEPLALSKAATRKLERQARKDENSNSNEPAPGLMVHDTNTSSNSPSSSGSSGTTSPSAATTPAGNSGIGIGSISLPSTTGSGSEAGSTSSTPSNMAFASLAGVSSSTSGSGSASTSSKGYTYIAGASQSEVLSSFSGDPQLSTADVQRLLERASKASASDDAIIAVVDRQGNILGVRVEAGVAITDTNTLVFAIDGAVSEARTAAYFSSDQGALTSRTVRYISQSTITQREVESNPSITDPSSTIAGPGFVAPIGVGGHFPPNIMNTPPVDLFAIENTNRDSLDAYADGGGRFDAMYIAGQEINAPGSFGLQSGLAPDAKPRGIATLPGGIPLYRDTGDADLLGDKLVGGIGVFFPGDDGYATHEQGFVAGDGKTTTARTNSALALEAEYIALVAAGASRGAGFKAASIGGTPPVDGLDLPFAQINLGGLILEGVGPTPGIEGARQLVQFGSHLGVGTNSGTDVAVTPAAQYLSGQPVPSGWLVAAHDSADGLLTAADVTKIINQGIKEANKTRAAIRALPTIGQRTKMILAVTDKTGEVLGLYRMPDTTYFSLDVAVAKARNVVYYDDPAKLKPIDQVTNIPAGTAFTNRTFRFLVEPRYPAGVDGSTPPKFSILNEVNPTTGKPLYNKFTAENIGPAAPASWMVTVLGHDAFNIGTNFRDDSTSPDLQNGIVFFPGSSAIYKNGKLVGGLGVSGDGVDQDDGVTAAAMVGYNPPSSIRADRYSVHGVRLPYFKFVRNPYG